MNSWRIIVSGVVQAVGFRPFIYRTAKKHNLKGLIRNVGSAVEISFSGKEDDMNSFLEEIRKNHPPLAEIDDIIVEEIEESYEDFKIIESEAKLCKVGHGHSDSVIPPDVAICDDCLKELFDMNDRRYNYPFMVCTNCGPRFTIIEEIPYDRKNTAMKKFKMCKSCEREYLEPLDRRCHAEPIACWNCGPRVFLINSNREEISQDIFEVSKLIDEGNIVAIKGVGGFHIACKASDDDVVLRMRNRRRREEQPFAVMVKDFEAVETFAEIDKNEKLEMESIRRPIVLLNKKEPFSLSKYIAPGLHTIGVMLPYAALHHLLMKETKELAWIMTSANFPGEPMIINEEEAFEKLNRVVDYYLVHNRKIANRCDDSVIRFIDNKISFLRRSRGYVPKYIDLEGLGRGFPNIVALSAEENANIALLKDKKCYLSQHIGNTDNIYTLDFLKSAFGYLMKITDTKNYEAVACDLHPNFNTTKYAKEISEKVIPVQHHHAHIASLMAEKNIEEIVGVACDGMGYGLDGIWGGEILLSNFVNFHRIASLSPYPLIGGDVASKYPIRVFLGILNKEVERRRIERYFERISYKGFRGGKKEFKISLKQLAGNINIWETTSMGRVLDAISAFLGICLERTYEGEPAMKLESYARKGEANMKIPVEFIEVKGVKRLDVGLILREIFENREKESKKDIAASAQKALAVGLAILVCDFSHKYGCPAGMSGGVAYNDSIVRIMREYIEGESIKFFTHTQVPPGDGGLALGQAIIAGSRILLDKI